MPIPQIIASIGSFLGNMGTAAAGASSLANLIGLGGNQTRVRREDFDHHQNLADVGNPREIRRQSQFLEGIAPAQANAYNTYQDATYAEDTRREIERQNAMNPVQAANDLAYMDTVYAGTSAWERLGSNAAPSISAPAPTDGAPRSGQPTDQMQSITPLVTTALQAENQKEIAFLNNMTSLAQTRMQTDDGNLPRSQGLAAAASAVASNAQAILTGVETDNKRPGGVDYNLKDAQTVQAREGARATRIGTFVDSTVKMFSLMGKEEVDLGIYKLSTIPGAEPFINALGQSLAADDDEMAAYGTSKDMTAIADAMKNLDTAAQSKVIREVAQIAAILGGTAKAGVGFLDDITRVFKPQRTTTYRSKNTDKGWEEETTTTKKYR